MHEVEQASSSAVAESKAALQQGRGGLSRLDDDTHGSIVDFIELLCILFVLRSGIPWEMLPLEMGCGSGVTCWRRLRYWQRRGVWKKLLHAMLDRLGSEGLIDWEKACVDSQSYRAVFGGS